MFGLCSQTLREKKKRGRHCCNCSDCLLGSIITSPIICQENKTPFKSAKLKPPEKNYWSNSSFPEVLTSSTLWQKLCIIARRRFRRVTEELDLRELYERFFLITLLVCGLCACSWKQQGILYTSHLAGAMWILVQEKPFLANV